MLIEDLNKKFIRYDFTEKMVIFDEAHRLLTNQLFNSIEASNVMEKHSFLSDRFFLNSIYQSKNAIVLTGTPMQKSAADLCKFANFLTKSNTFTLEKYASRTFLPSTVIFLARHWKFLNGFATTFGTELVTETVKAAAVNNDYLKLLIPFIPAITETIVTYIMSIPLERKDFREIAYQSNNKTRGGNTLSNKKNKKNKITKKHKLNILYKNVSNVSNVSNVYNGGASIKGIFDITLKTLQSSSISFLSNIYGSDTAFSRTITKTIAPKQWISMFYTEPKITDVQAIVADVEEPYYDVKTLANDMSDFISIYDYEEQQNKLCNINNF